MKSILLWIGAARAPFFTASIIPVLLGSAIAWAQTGNFGWGFFWLTLLGGLFLHAGANLINDYFDHRNKSDEINTEFVRPFTGGSRFIQNKILSPGQVLFAAVTCFVLGSGIGLFLSYKLGWVILALGATGVFSSVFYTGQPFYLAKRGIGEFFVGLNFGVLMTLGAYYVQARSFSWAALLASFPVALLIAAVLYINQFQDYQADKQVGKTHLVVRLGRKKATIGYVVIMLATYLSILAGVISKILTPWTLLALLTLPMAMKGIMVARANYDKSKELTPANVATVLVHLLTGILLTGGYIISKLV